jgi:folylpolyglutamate synthase/dihydropteroate synthase
LTGRKELVLLDGAHNPQSVAALAGYVEKHQRQSLMPITWIIATTKGKALDEMLPQLLKPGDKLIAVEFGPVESMPWVEPTAAGDILKQAQICLDKDDFCTTSTNVQQALMIATETAKGGPIVIAGSLYLIGDILRLLRNHEELFVYIPKLLESLDFLHKHPEARYKQDAPTKFKVSQVPTTST